MRLFLLVTFLIFNLQAKPLFSNTQQADSSIYIGSLKDLVIATQKTRGLTNSYMNGNTAALLLVYANRQEMKKAIGTMESLPMAADPIINSRATTISQSLITLNNKAFKQKSSVAFSNYTGQIGQTLMLAQNISKRSAKELNPFGQEASAIMMEIMLPMTEYVGQLRGFGSGLAAKGKRSEKELAKVLVLVNKVKTLNIKLQSDMNKLISKYPTKLSSSISSEVSAINQSANSYTKFAQSKFAKDIQNIDPNTYFEDGTKLISKIIKAYNTNNGAILEDSKGWL